MKHLFPTTTTAATATATPTCDLPCAGGLFAAFSASTDNVLMRRFRSLFCLHLMTSLNALLLNCSCSGDGDRIDRIRDRVLMVIRKLYRVGDDDADAEHHLVTCCDDPTQYDWLLMELHASTVVSLHCPNDEQAASNLVMVMGHLQTILANLLPVSLSADSDHGITGTNGSEAQHQRLVFLFRAAVLSSMLSYHHSRYQQHFDDTVSDRNLHSLSKSLTHTLTQRLIATSPHITSHALN